MLTCEEAVSCGYLLDVMARLAIAALRQIGERSRITGSLPEKQSQNPDRALRSRCDAVRLRSIVSDARRMCIVYKQGVCFSIIFITHMMTYVMQCFISWREVVYRKKWTFDG